MKARIVKRNSKVPYPMVNLTPGKTCSKDATCRGRKRCYATKFYQMWPTVRQNWDHNTKACMLTPIEFHDSIRQYLATKQPSHFRWHSSGDAPTVEYMRDMVKTAYMFPHIKFLAFTKQYKLLRQLIKTHVVPKNLSIIVSLWHDMRNPRGLDQFVRAWVVGSKERRIPRTAYTCPASCEICTQCWHTKVDISFHKH